MRFSLADKRALTFRAAGIYERHAALGRAGSATPDEAGEAVLRAWNQAFSPGDPAAFERRLAWDGLDRQTVAALVAPDAEAAMPIADWTAWLDDVAEAAIDVGRELESAGAIQSVPADGIPFIEIWTAWERAAKRVLLETTSAPALRGLAPAVLTSCARQLVTELSRQGELALFEAFKRISIENGGRDRYRTFVHSALNDGLRDLMLSFPALTRSLASLSADWIAGTREWMERLHADRAALAATFESGGDPGCLASVELGLSDPHHGRRRVHALQFASGRRLVYKPRSVAIERVFAELMTWLNPALAVPVPVLRVLDRETHGWVEFAEHAPLASRADAERYYHQSGALMCVTWALRGRDLHMENLVATSRGPVLIDLEMLLQPISQSAARVADAIGERHASALVEESSLSTGLLSLIEITPRGDAQDSGGLRGQRRGQLPFARRAWKDLGTATLHYDEEPMFSAPGRHEVRLDGEIQRPGDYPSHLLVGFDDAYRALLSRREELLSTSGPLQRFASCATRVLPRPTNQYAMLSYVLAAPKYQGDAIARSTAVDVLHRAFSGAATRPDLWQVAVEERRGLERLDVPYFSVRCDGTDATCEGRLVARGYFARSGIEAAASRVRGMSIDDLASQRAMIARALREPVDSVYSTAIDERAPAAGVAAMTAGIEHREFLDAALWIARELVAHADRPASTHHLYDGSLGPAVFFGALAAITRDPAWREKALAALEPLRAHVRRGLPADEHIGALAGIGSIVYAGALLGGWLDDQGPIDLARHALSAIEARVADDRCLDVIDGAAGAALALLALESVTGDRRALDVAAACGRHLVEKAVPTGDGLVWPSADGRWLVGFAHGAAGIVAALARLADATSDDTFRDAARRGCRFVARQFLPAPANFAIASERGEAPSSGHRIMTAWCHGAPGVVLGIASALDICEKAAILSGFDRAVRTTARADVIQPDHLCCGSLGRAEVLLAIGTRLERPDLRQAAVELGAGVLARAIHRRHFRLSGAGSDYRVFDPGFFRGLSGIGYEMLRLAAPGDLPSVAALEPVAVGTSPGHHAP